MFIKNQLKEYRQKETRTDDTETFRVGNVGYIDADGDIRHGCHRKAIARKLGLTRNDPGVNVFFEVGRASEDFIVGRLSPDYEVRRETECRLHIQDVPSKVVVEGHSDLTFWDKGVMIAGGELKATSSVWQLDAPYASGHPKISNLIQAGTYSYISGVPFYLFYKAYAKPLSFQKNMENFQSEVEFKVYIKENKIFYDKEDGETVDSGITVEGILDYYKLCQELIDKKQLYREPVEEKYDHKKYCDECRIAKTADSFDSWVSSVRAFYEGKK